MIAMISTSTGDMIGPGVKFMKLEPCPSMKIQVRMPSVAPRPSAVISTALIGRTRDPNARNISTVVSSTTSVTISGRLPSSAAIESCSIAGVPPTSMVTPSGSSIERR